jgi:outer membrane protein assembly factor BamD (BamD/ComL family)
MPRLSTYVIVCLLLILGGLGWFVFRTISRAEDPARMLFKWILTLIILGFFGWGVFKEIGFSQAGAFIVPFVCVFIGLILTALWAPHIGALVARPLTSLFDGGDIAPEPQPLYSIAIARRKQGQHREALYHIQEQLQKFPKDAFGQLLLAEIQADDLKDLQAAEVTVGRFVDQPGHAPGAVAMALHQLADWRLKLGQDIDGAVQALQNVVDRFPGSEHAQIATQRIAHLSRGHMTFGPRDPLKLKEGVQVIGLMAASAHLKPVEDDPVAKAEEYVRHLELHPADAEVREKLAEIYAEHYQRLDLAISQFEDLLQVPNQPPKLVAHLLNRLADFHVKYNSDLESARAALERIIEAFPASAHAEKARSRIEYLRLSMRVRETAKPIHLGAYETDLGLKQQRPKNP